MVSQLLTNDKISFVCARNFSSRGKDYEVGDDFPQEDARDIEVFVRARYVIPVIDSIEDKQFIRHWHRELRPKDEVLERLARERVQLVMPEPYHEHDENDVDLDVLTHPETTPPPEETSDEPYSDQDLPGEYDPSEHTVDEVNKYLAEHPDDAGRVLAAERADRGRKGILGDD